MNNYKKRVAWLANTNIYEVNVRQFTKEGTFNAFVQHLPRLKKMGVEVLWFMPITPIAQEKRKGSLGSQYACMDYTSINPEFGSILDFKNLVKTAYSMGFKVIIDWVANHTGWDHVWTRSHPEYYLKDDAGNFKTASGMDDIIELDYSVPALRKAMIEAMQFWISETNIDGFRCDLAAWVCLDFWQEARLQLEITKPLFWLGEFDELDNPDYGTVFDASYSWAWMHATKEFADGKKNLTDLWSLLKRYNDLGDSGMRAWFTSNHDENSWNGTEYEKYGKLALPLAVFSATWNGVPLMYNGQELPLLKRLQFFDKDMIPWEADCLLNTFYTKLLQLKKSNNALRGSDNNVATHIIETNEPDKVMCYVRVNGNHMVFVIINLSDEHIQLEMKLNNFKGAYFDVLTNQEIKIESSVVLDEYGFQVFYQ